MLTALTHRPSPNITDCELTFLSHEPIDFEKATEQHEQYCETLKQLGVHVVVLEENKLLPDSVFVEDTALVLDKLAVITPMGTKSREQETKAIKTALTKFRPLARIEPPAKIEGGDILRVGKKLFIGNSVRTNNNGFESIRKITEPLGYIVKQVKVSGCLHLKTGCTALDDKTVLINPDWVDQSAFEEFEQIEVPKNEPFAANILRIGKTICIHTDFAETKELLKEEGYKIEALDISEFLKAEAGLTCMSLVFETGG